MAVVGAIEEPLCGRGGSAGKLQRFTAHQRFLGAQADAIEAELAAAAKRWRAEGKWAAWARVISPPQPCLKCAMLTPRVVSAPYSPDTPLAIGFADGAGGDPDKAALEALKAALDAEPALKVVLRGHADPAEKNPGALALARAKAVQAARARRPRRADRGQVVRGRPPDPARHPRRAGR